MSRLSYITARKISSADEKTVERVTEVLRNAGGKIRTSRENTEVDFILRARLLHPDVPRLTIGQVHSALSLMLARKQIVVIVRNDGNLIKLTGMA